VEGGAVDVPLALVLQLAVQGSRQGEVAQVSIVRLTQPRYLLASPKRKYPVKSSHPRVATSRGLRC
jgi:hypothetical protein